MHNYKIIFDLYSRNLSDKTANDKNPRISADGNLRICNYIIITDNCISIHISAFNFTN